MNDVESEEECIPFLYDLPPSYLICSHHHDGSAFS